MDDNEVKLFCSAGRGTEKFVEKELREVYSSSLKHFNRVTDGKIFFSINQTEDINSLLKLKTVERLFLELNCFKTSRLPYGKGKGQFVNALKRRLVKESRFLKAADIFENFNHPENESSVSNDAPVTKKLKLENLASKKKCFRVSCKISGKFAKLASAQELNIELGKYIAKLTGWNIDLKHPLLEISVHINDEMVVAGIPLTREPLSKRDYIIHSGLRSPVAWILGYLTQIQPGDIVLDPMCGKSTILIEAAKCLQPNAVYFGIDRNHQQLKTAQANVQFAACENNIHLLLSNGLDLPFKSGSVDKVICDAPFGEKHKIASNIHQFYYKLLLESHRVLRNGGRFVLLTSSSLQPYVVSLLKSCPEHFKKSEHIHSEDGDELPNDMPKTSQDAGDKMVAKSITEKACNSNMTSEENGKVPKLSREHFVFDNHNLTSICDRQNETSILDKNETANSDEVINDLISECDMKNVTSECEKVVNKCDSAVCKVTPLSKHNRVIKTCVEENVTRVSDTSETKSSEEGVKDEVSSKHDNVNYKAFEENSGQILGKENNKLLFIENHYMKLGETHAYIIVAEKKMNFE